MKDQEKKEFRAANAVLIFLAAAISTTAIIENVAAKSLYVIADINARPTPVQAYDIAVDGALTFQAQYDVPHHMFGAVGLAIDSDSGHVFVTYEDSNEIQLVEATTMTEAGTAAAPGADNLAGIVYDHAKGLLYCVDRGKDKLYAYDWDPNTTTLTNMPGSPFTLQGATAYGIALDEIDGFLYVANCSTEINVYNTSDWSSVRTILVSRIAIGVAVDVRNGFVYSGAGFADNYYLSRYHLATGTQTEIQVEPDAGVMGLAVDPGTGLVYMSTGRNYMPGGDNILVYDTSLNRVDIVTNIGNPTGLAVPGRDIGYNPLSLSKEAIDGVVGETPFGELKSVGAGGEITYGIYFNNSSNEYSVTDIVIVDTLPDQVSFVTADDDGVHGHYDPNTHTYTWSYSSLPPGSATCLKIVVRVNQDITPGTSITNSVTINSNETPPTTTGMEVVTSYNLLNLSKNVLGNVGGQVKWVDPNEIVTYNICCDNNDNDYTVTDVSVVDILPEQVSFVTADDEGASGQYDPNTHTFTWSYPSLSPGLTTCLDLVVRVNQDTPPGTTIINSVIIDSNEIPPSTDSVDIITKYNPLNLSKSIAGGIAGEVDCVDVNETIAYSICFDNNDNDCTVTGVSIVDILPDEVSFVTADGDGVFGHYDPNTHTYTWSHPSVPAGSTTCLELVARVNQGIAPGKTITNSAIIDSKETPPTTASVDAVSSQPPLKLTKSIVGAVDGQADCVDVTETVTYSISFENDRDYTVNNVSIVDTLPDEVSFVAADGDGDLGEYDPDTHTYTWLYPSLAPGSPTFLQLVVQVNQDTPPVTTITNSVTVDSRETLPATASADVTTCETSVEVDDMRIIPNRIIRESLMKNLLVVIWLPRGLGKSDIVDKLPVMYPGKISAKRQFVFGTRQKAWILAWFDKAEVMEAVPGYGRVKFRVVGKSKPNKSFYGETFVYLTKRGAWPAEVEDYAYPDD
jgi:uncharacterized repeat protein (TIGR01451 family)